MDKMKKRVYLTSRNVLREILKVIRVERKNSINEVNQELLDKTIYIY